MRLAPILASSLALAVALSVSAWAAAPDSHDRSPCRVPDLTNSFVIPAVNAVAKRNCSTRLRSEDPIYETSKVDTQTPGPGTELPAGGAVTLNVVRAYVIKVPGPSRRGSPPRPAPPTANVVCLVPKLKGKTIVPAVEGIVHGRCALGRVEVSDSVALTGARVASQTPRAGGRFRVGTKVNIALK